jgi:hypothetical protein
VPNAGVNLTGATTLTFAARGKFGGERIEVFVAGVGRDANTGNPTAPYPDSSRRRPNRGTVFVLTNNWQQFSIDLTGMDLSYVLGGLGWVADSFNNPNGAEFYLDNIKYEFNKARRKARSNEARFLTSFVTLPVQPDPFDEDHDADIDFVLRNLAFTYDNALALLAFLGDGSSDSVRRATLIGDALVYALQHDRTFNDNRSCNQPINPQSVDGARFRSAYSAGDNALPAGWTPNGRVGTVPIPGFYAEATKTFYEVEQQAIDTGVNLWAGRALSALYRRTSDPRYLDAACKIGNFVEAVRHDSGIYRGFRDGIDNPETSPSVRTWASNEHNLDAAAFYADLYEITGDSRWQLHAAHGQQFVEAMFDTTRHCYLAGTTDPNTRNTTPGQLPLDVQTWSFLALPAPVPHPEALDCAEANHLNQSDGFVGVDFNEDKDGVWFEGTGQLALAEERADRLILAEELRTELRRAQQTKPFGDRSGIAAASHDGLSTGFLTHALEPFKYFRRLHVGATAWNFFAQADLNPYRSRELLIHLNGRGRVTVPSAGKCRSTCASSWLDGATVTLRATPSTGWRIASWSSACASVGTSAECRVSLRESEEIVVTFVPTTP